MDTITKQDKTQAAYQQAVDVAVGNANEVGNRAFTRLEATLYDYKRGLLTTDEFIAMTEQYTGLMAKCSEHAAFLEDGTVEPGYGVSLGYECPVCGVSLPDEYVPCNCELQSGLPLPSKKAIEKFSPIDPYVDPIPW